MSFGESMDTGRRAFLTGALLTRDGRESAQRNRRPWGPSPPWQEGVSQAGDCQACGYACVDACEQHIIRIHPPEHALAGSPYLSFEGAGCTWCGGCADACGLVAERAPLKPKMGSASINAQKCLAWSGTVCMSCQGACPEQAIHFDPRTRPGIEESGCLGCGFCVSACPVQAISVHFDRGAPTA